MMLSLSSVFAHPSAAISMPAWPSPTLRMRHCSTWQPVAPSSKMMPLPWARMSSPRI